MSTKSFFCLSLLALSLPLSAADLSPTAKDAAAPTSVPTIAASPVATVAASPVASPSLSPVATAAVPVTPTAPVAAPVSPAAEAVAPALPEDLSGSSETLAAPAPATFTAGSDDAAPEEVGEDGGTAFKTESPDLAKLDSETLAAIANGVDKDASDVYFDGATKQALPGAAPGAWKVSVDPLYYELAKRTLNDNKDKAARQAFALSLFKDADRAKFAKDLAYDDKLADTVIAQLEAGRPRARMELQGLAEKGNRKARAYLGLDKPTERVEAGALSGTAQAASGTASALPVASTPTVAAVAASGTAVSAPAALTGSAAQGLSGTAAPVKK